MGGPGVAAEPVDEAVDRTGGAVAAVGGRRHAFGLRRREREGRGAGSHGAHLRTDAGLCLREDNHPAFGSVTGTPTSIVYHGNRSTL
jgi:hypothetical protein